MIAAVRELAQAVDAPVLDGDKVRPYLGDATEARGLHGRADAVVLARTPQHVADTLAWCYAHDVPLTVRGGGTGYAGGAVPDGGVVVALEGLRTVRSIEPLQWRAEVESGLTTSALQELARENGLYFPPDPGAAEQSQIGGNVATNAGGPHAFKYGVTGAWVAGLEVALARRARDVRRTRPQGRGGLRPARADRRLGGHSRHRDRRPREADPAAAVPPPCCCLLR